MPPLPLDNLNCESKILCVVRPAAVVLDCFTGAGTTGVACIQTGRCSVDIALDPVRFENVYERISEAERQGALFDHADDCSERVRFTLEEKGRRNDCTDYDRY